VWATQSPFFERSLVQSAKHCCLQERPNNGVFCSRMFLLCTPLKYDHIPCLISLPICGTFPSQDKLSHCVTVPEIWLRVLKWTKHQLFCIIIFQCYIRSFLLVLHLVWIIPSYSRKTINRMHTKINMGNFWLHCDVTLFMLKLKISHCSTPLGVITSTEGIPVNRLLVPIFRVP
jgi:hypothetical protein